MASNKKIGNDFESQFCEYLFNQGFWVHNMVQNASGQPADVIAVKGNIPYLIDCKVCSNDKFNFSRIEENQVNAMKLWKECGNTDCWFALFLSTGTYMISIGMIQMLIQRGYKNLTKNHILEIAIKLEEWCKYANNSI